MPSGRIHLKPIIHIIGALLMLIGLLMLTCLPFSAIDKTGEGPSILLSSGISILLGFFCWWNTRSKDMLINKREGYLIVSMGWLTMGIFAALPYWLSGYISSPADAFFESVSGLTTTGATILTDIEILPRGILFWRSLTQWIGGMGIIVLTVALFPLLGIGGVELFTAEAPGPTSSKIHPRISESAKRLWLIYVGLTLLLFITLWVEGMTWFDAINHALTCMATGGFSTKNISIAYYSPLIQYTITLFMFIAGINYTVIYYTLIGKPKISWKNEEFRTYFILMIGLVIAMTLLLVGLSDKSLEVAFREVAFSTVSVVTTTGYIIADYTTWGYGIAFIFFLLLFVGGSAGSTAGGIKTIRILAVTKNMALEFKKILHPRAVVRLKINRELVAPNVVTHILVFFLIYLITFILGTMILSFMQLDFLTALGATATSLGNVGPGIGSVGPVDNFAHLPYSAKWFLAFLMLLGRLELFSILILFSRSFWKTN